MGEVTVAICTRDRPAKIHGALAALDAQTRQDFAVVVVDQSVRTDSDLTRRAVADPRLALVRDSGRGLSRSRNLAWRTIQTEWIAFVDDDCVLAPDWIEELHRAIEAHPEVGFITGHVGTGDEPSSTHMAAAARPVCAERIVAGRWASPAGLGFGVCMVLRRSVVVAQEGWDERFGAGVPEFPAGEDVDFNYRFLRYGGIGLATPRLRAVHDQWRSQDETVRLYRGYAVAGAAFPIKHLRTGDPLGGAYLWLRHSAEVARLLLSGMRHRSRLRARIAAAQIAGVAEGTVRALVRRW